MLEMVKDLEFHEYCRNTPKQLLCVFRYHLPRMKYTANYNYIRSIMAENWEKEVTEKVVGEVVDLEFGRVWNTQSSEILFLWIN